MLTLSRAQLLISIMMFYDAPSHPSGIFDQFLAIPSASYDVSVRSYLDLVLTEDVSISANLRCAWTMTPHAVL